MQTKQNFKLTVNFRPLLIAFLSLLAGLSFARFLYGGNPMIIALSVIIFVFLILHSVIKRKFYALVIAIVFFFGGNGLYFLSFNSFMGREYQTAYITGRVCSINSANSLVLEDVVANSQRVSGVRLTVSGAEDGDFEVGDIVMFEGSLEHEKMFTLGSFNSYDYRQGIAYFSSCEIADVNVVSGSKKFDEQARERIKDALYANMDINSANLALAVLTGDKSGVDEQILSSFSGAGIVHILTVSGLHVSFLIMILAFIFKKLRFNKYVNFVLLFAFSFLYAAICGFAPSIVRAMIMGLVVTGAGLIGKEYDRLNSLSIAGIITLFIFPLFALDVGFLMSYGCVFALVLLHGPIYNILSKVFPNFISNAIATSLAAEIGALPFSAAFFSTFNFLGVFSNFIAVPFFSLIFGFLIFGVIITLIFPVCGIILKPCQWGFMGLTQIANVFSSTVLKMTIAPFDAIFIALLFCCIFVGSYYFLASGKAKWAITLVLTIAMTLCTMISSATVYDGTSVSLISKGYSAIMFLQSQSGQTLCVEYDEGVAKYFLSKQKLSHVDYLISPESYCGYGGKTLFDDEGYAGDFKYAVKDGAYIFEVDGVKIFFTNLSNVSYNENVSKMLNEERYDFVYTYSVLDDCDCGFYATMQAGGSDYSLKQSGSMTYGFSDHIAWGID